MCSLAALARGCRPAAKPCCLCWCCCCSCSCLAARGSDAEPGKKPREAGPHDPLLCDGDQAPSLEEIRSWGQSFDRLMRSAAGRKVFRDFLRGEYSEENIMFWLACEELKRETDPDAIEEKARFIYEDYISILSPKEVSLDSRVREVVNRNMVEPTPHTFDEAQLQIYTLMHRDSYPRFVASPLYKTLAKLTNGSPSGAPDNQSETKATEVKSPDSRESRIEFKDSKTEFKDSKAEFKDSKAEFKDSRTDLKDLKPEFKDSKKESIDSRSPSLPSAAAPAPTSETKQ